MLFAAVINDGTAGVQRLLGAIAGMTYDGWQKAVGPDGLYATYERLFGNPFGYAVEPLLPAAIDAPSLELPWAAGETWYFTGGPHGAWNTGSAWGALDFVPPAEQVGCIPSDAWVTAMANGVVSRSGHGAVVVDLDGDGYAGTGWAILYMHLETRDRAAVALPPEASRPPSGPIFATPPLPETRRAPVAGARGSFPPAFTSRRGRPILPTGSTEISTAMGPGPGQGRPNQ